MFEGNEIVVLPKPHLTEIPDWLAKILWTCHIHFLPAIKEDEDRVFCILAAIYLKNGAQRMHP